MASVSSGSQRSVHSENPFVVSASQSSGNDFVTPDLSVGSVSPFTESSSQSSASAA